MLKRKKTSTSVSYVSSIKKRLFWFVTTILAIWALSYFSIYRLQYNLHEMDRHADKFHLKTLHHLDLINKELTQITNEALKYEIRSIKDDTPAPILTYYSPSTSRHLIASQWQEIKTLHEAFHTHTEFDQTFRRVERQWRLLNKELLLITSTQKTDFQSIFEDTQPFQLSINQLRKLHFNNYKKITGDMLGQKRTVQIFTAILIISVISFGGAAIIFLFRAISKAAVEQDKSSQAIAQKERSLSNAQRIAKIGSWTFDISKKEFQLTAQAAHICGLAVNKDKYTYQQIIQRISNADRRLIKKAFLDILKNEKEIGVVIRFRVNDENIKYAQILGEIEHASSTNKFLINGTIQDITERKFSEKNINKFSSALAQTADAIMITNREGVIEYVNSAFESISGYTRNEALGNTPRILKSGEQKSEIYELLWNTLLSGDVFTEVLLNRRKDGTIYYEEKTISPLKDEHGEITHFISAGKDITERMQNQERMHYLAHHDVLTKLPNRMLFSERLNHSIDLARRNKLRTAVLFIDLDRFKNINDTLGHRAGDQLIQTVSSRLLETIRKGDTVARIGGDEFAVILEEVESAEAVQPISDKILRAITRPINIENNELFVSASVGISVFPLDGEDGESLLKHADTAMYQAKERGRNNYQFYSRDMSIRVNQRLALETDLHRALDAHEYEAFYQPQYNLETKQIISMEALIRWNHPSRGIVSPAGFIPTLEETGLIIKVGQWMLWTAAIHAKAINHKNQRNIRVSVNLSARQFSAPNLIEDIQRLLSETGVNPSHLEFEITESAIMQDAESALNILKEIKSMGIRLAIDDFGTGYSSLAYLKRFPIDTLKIDRSFIADTPHDPEDVMIVKAIIALSHNLNVEVIAEGVESSLQAEFLKDCGCDIGQGYYFNAPLPAREINHVLRNKEGVNPSVVNLNLSR